MDFDLGKAISSASSIAVFLCDPRKRNSILVVDRWTSQLNHELCVRKIFRRLTNAHPNFADKTTLTRPRCYIFHETGSFSQSQSIVTSVVSTMA